jgi:hypothetical protein
MNRHVVTLVNRTDRDFAFTFDGVGYIVPASEELDVTEEVGNHARKKSIKSYDLETGRADYQVGIKGIHNTSFMGKGKLAEEELINRETDLDGDKAKVVNVRGGKVAPGRDVDALAGQEE